MRDVLSFQSMLQKVLALTLFVTSSVNILGLVGSGCPVSCPTTCSANFQGPLTIPIPLINAPRPNSNFMVLSNGSPFCIGLVDTTDGINFYQCGATGRTATTGPLPNTGSATAWSPSFCLATGSFESLLSLFNMRFFTVTGCRDADPRLNLQVLGLDGAPRGMNWACAPLADVLGVAQNTLLLVNGQHNVYVYLVSLLSLTSLNIFTQFPITLDSSPTAPSVSWSPLVNGTINGILPPFHTNYYFAGFVGNTLHVFSYAQSGLIGGVITQVATQVTTSGGAINGVQWFPVLNPTANGGYFIGVSTSVGLEVFKFIPTPLSLTSVANVALSGGTGGSSAIAVSPDGSAVAVNNNGNTAVFAYSFDPSTSALNLLPAFSPNGFSPAAPGTPVTLAWAPDCSCLVSYDHTNIACMCFPTPPPPPSPLTVTNVTASPNCSKKPATIQGTVLVADTPCPTNSITVTATLGGQTIASKTLPATGGSFTLRPGANLPAGFQTVFVTACCTGTTTCSASVRVKVGPNCCCRSKFK